MKIVKKLLRYPGRARGIFSRGAVSFIVAATAINASNFVFHVVVSRLIGPSIYGALGSLLSIISVLSVPLGALQLSVTQSVVNDETGGDDEHSLRHVTFRCGIAALAGTAAFCLFIPTIGAFLHLPSRGPLLLVAAWIPLATVGAVLQGALIGESRFVSVAAATFAGQGLARLLVGVVLSKLGFGLMGSAAATLLGQCLTIAVLLAFTRRRLFHREMPLRLVRSHVALSVFALAGYTAFASIDTFLARHFLPASSAGKYAAAAVAAHIALFLSGAIVAVVFPQFARGGGDTREGRSAFAHTFIINAVLGAGAAAVLAIGAREIITVLFGDGYLGAVSQLVWLAPTSALMGLLSVVTYHHIARRSLAALASWLGVAIAAALIALDHHTPVDVAIVMLGATTLTLLTSAAWSLAAISQASATDFRSDFSLADQALDLTLVVCNAEMSDEFSSQTRQLVDTLSETTASFEILALSTRPDGPVDDLPAQVRRISDADGTNAWAAFRVGLSEGKGAYIGVLDAAPDLPVQLAVRCAEVITTRWPDLVVSQSRPTGSFGAISDRLVSFGYRWFTRVLVAVQVEVTGSRGLFARREFLAEALPRMVEERIAPEVELQVLARHLGYRDVVGVAEERQGSAHVALRSVLTAVSAAIGVSYRLRIRRSYGEAIAAPRVRSLSANERTRILILNWRDLKHPRAGGAEVYTQSVAEHWARQGHAVTLLAAHVENQPEQEIVNGVTILRRGGRLGVYRKARTFWKKEGRHVFDLVVDGVNTRPFLTPRFVRRVPVVALIHQVCREIWHYEAPFPVSVIGRYWLEPRWLRTYTNVPVVTVSDSSRASLEEYGLRRVTVVPEGWTTHRRDSSWRREASPTLVFVGRLSRNKRPEDCIEAFRQIRARLPESKLWVIGSGPMEDELRAGAPEGVTFFGRVDEEEKLERLARAHLLLVPSVREGWGLVVSEAAQVGTMAIGYDVPGLRDSITASAGVLCAPSPSALAESAIRLLPELTDGQYPKVELGGVLPWKDVAQRLLDVARDAELEQADDTAPMWSRVKNAARGYRLAQVRNVAGGVGVAAIFMLGGTGTGTASLVASGVAFVGLLVATALGLAEGGLSRGVLTAKQAFSAIPVRTRSFLPGLALVLLTTTLAVQTWFRPGEFIAQGDITPVTGTAWIDRLFSAWSSNGSNLGAPAANEVELPWALVYSAVRALGGSPAAAQQVWYTLLFAGAGGAAYLLLKSLRIGQAGAAIGALAFVFNSYMISGTVLNPPYVAAMMLSAGLPAVIINVATGRIRPVVGLFVVAFSSPLLGYVYLNPPLLLMVGTLVALTPFLLWWLDGREAFLRAIKILGVAVPIVTALCAYWLVPSILELKLVSTSTLAAPTSWNWTEGRSTLANGFWLNTAWGWSYPDYFPYAPLYSTFPLNLIKYAIPALAFIVVPFMRISGASSAAQRISRLALAMSATALFVVLLSTGTRLPGSIVFDPLYRLPLGWLLREPGRFLAVAALAYSVMLAIAVEHLGALLRNAGSRATNGTRRVARLLPITAAWLLGGIVIIGAFPLASGAVTSGQRTPLPGLHVKVPFYWNQMASFVNHRRDVGRVFLLPEDDFYMMPYAWSYYGSDGFIQDLINKDLIDPGQGYDVVAKNLRNGVSLVQSALLASDWRQARLVLNALHSPYVLVRGDIVSATAGRHIASPASLAQALSHDPDFRLLHTSGPLRLYELRDEKRIGPSTSYATVNSNSPSLNDLLLLNDGTSLISKPMRPGVPAIVEVPQITHWVRNDGELSYKFSEPAGWTYSVHFITNTGGQRDSRASRFRVRATTVNGQRIGIISTPLGDNELPDGDFSSGQWRPVGNCAQFPGTTALAQIGSRVIPHAAPGGSPALELSASADSACMSQPVKWTSGAVLVSLQQRNVTGVSPRICLWEAAPINKCAPIASSSTKRETSGWFSYSALVKPDSGTKHMMLFVYADVLVIGNRTINQYADISVRNATEVARPIIVANPAKQAANLPILKVDDQAYAASWNGPAGSTHVEVDGLVNGWLTPKVTAEKATYEGAIPDEFSWIASAIAAFLIFVGLIGYSIRRLYRRSIRAALGVRPDFEGTNA
jgi:glycosyltransferase involved in cell wall biosynthesis/O-antigen/teichoic acid export membrane protein